MKVSDLRVLAGMSVALIATEAAFGGYVGVSVSSARYPGPIIVFNMYAQFDRPGPGDGLEDHMRTVAGTPNTPLNIEVIGGTFYNHQFSTDQAPGAAFVSAFPSLAHDTFVTVGINMVGDPEEFPGAQPLDELVITPGFPIGLTGSALHTTLGGWTVLPIHPQGDPFDSLHSFPGDGRVLIGRFSTKAGN